MYEVLGSDLGMCENRNWVSVARGWGTRRRVVGAEVGVG